MYFEFLHYTKKILEIWDLISWPIIAFLAYKWLEQISETKKSRLLSAQRDAYTIAAEKCTYYAENIVPLINSIDEEIEKRWISSLNEATTEVKWNNIKTNITFKNLQEQLILCIEIPTLDLFNKLDSLALFFTKGIADEQIGYLNFGKSFCYTMKRYMPLVIDTYKYGHFQSLIELFLLWSQKIEKEKLELQKNSIENELNKINEIKIPYIGIK